MDKCDEVNIRFANAVISRLKPNVRIVNYHIVGRLHQWLRWTQT